MKFPKTYLLQEIAAIIDCEYVGEATFPVYGMNEIHVVEQGDIVFVDHPKYYDKCINSLADFILINKEVDCPTGKALLIVANPFEAYCKIVNHFRPFTPSTTIISNSAKIGEGSFIYPNSFIGNNVVIGKNCIIYPNVSILDYCVLGDNVIIQSSTVIGSDAFYYNTKKDNAFWYKRMPSCGTVLIEDNVEIGSGCTIDRGVSHNTIIGAGTKFDNQIHIGHDTVVGKNCLFATGVIVAGVVTIEDGVTIWGGVIVNKTLTIGENAVLLGRTGVSSSIMGNKTYWGTPAQEASVVKRELIWIKRIPQIWEKVMGK